MRNIKLTIFILGLVGSWLLIGTLVNGIITRENKILDLDIKILDLESDNLDRLEEIQTLKVNLKDAQSKLRYLEEELYGDSEDECDVVEIEDDLKENKTLLGVFETTAYTDNVRSQGKWVGQTATGRKPQVGVVAVDPKVIPLETKLYIEGYGHAIAGDVGGAIKGKRIDVFKNSSSECKSWGRQQKKVWVIK